MGIVKLNLAKTLEATAGNSLFLDVPKDGEVRVRPLPPLAENGGNLWYLTENHFRLKAEDGEKGIAVACNERHGDGDSDCLLCKVARHFENSPDAAERALGKGRNAIRANRSWYFQVLPITKDGDKFVAGDVKLMRLPKTAADAVNKILGVQQRNGENLSCGVDAAQDIVISRQDTGVNITQYSAMPAGKPTALADYLPDYETKMLSAAKVWERLDLKVMTYEQQLEVLERSYPVIDWSAVMEEIS